MRCMKVAFLDVDGVLNTNRTCIAYGGYARNCEQIERLDPVAIGLIKNICNAAGASIVLSSVWRKHADWVEFGPKTGLPVIDRTKSLCSGIRGEEIEEWLERHPEVTHYAIIDDSSDLLSHHFGRFVKTSFKDGFTWQHAEQLAKLLDLTSAWDASPKKQFDQDFNGRDLL